MVWKMLRLKLAIQEQHKEECKLQDFYRRYDRIIPLHHAIAHGVVKLAQYIVNAGYNINTQDEEGTTPLMLAVSHPNNVSIDLVTFLIEAGADIFMTDTNNRNAIKIVFDQTRHMKVEVVDIFLNIVKTLGFNNIELMGKLFFETNCPLQHIVRCRNVELTRHMLIKYNYPIDAFNPLNQRTALHVAVEQMDMEHIKLLVAHGADVNSKDSKCFVPLSFYSSVAESTDENLEIIRFLMDKGTLLIETFPVSPYAYAPLAPLYARGKQEVIRILLEYNADLSTPNRYKCAPLHYVSCNKNPGIAKELKDKNFDVDVKDEFGFTPLMYAMGACNKSFVKLLLKKGADINHRVSNINPMVFQLMSRSCVGYDPERQTKVRYEACVEILLQHGADLDAIFRFELSPPPDIYTARDEVSMCIHDYLRRPILAYLAKLEVLNGRINEKYREKINSYPVWKRGFTLYKRELEKMRKTKIYRSLDMFTLISDHEMEFVRRFHCHSKIVSKLRSLNTNKFPNSYLYRQLKKRINKTIKVLKVRVIAAAFISKVLNLPSNDHIITQSILNYLRYSDHKKLARIYCVLKH